MSGPKPVSKTPLALAVLDIASQAARDSADAEAAEAAAARAERRLVKIREAASDHRADVHAARRRLRDLLGAVLTRGEEVERVVTPDGLFLRTTFASARVRESPTGFSCSVTVVPDERQEFRHGGTHKSLGAAERVARVILGPWTGLGRLHALRLDVPDPAGLTGLLRVVPACRHDHSAGRLAPFWEVWLGPVLLETLGEADFKEGAAEAVIEPAKTLEEADALAGAAHAASTVLDAFLRAMERPRPTPCLDGLKIDAEAPA